MMMVVARVLTIDMHTASTSVEADLSLSCLSLEVHKQYFTMDPARLMEIFIYRGSLFNFVGPGFRFSLSTYGSSDVKKGQPNEPSGVLFKLGSKTSKFEKEKDRDEVIVARKRCFELFTKLCGSEHPALE